MTNNKQTAQQFEKAHIIFCGYSASKCDCCSDFYLRLKQKEVKP